MLRRAAVLLFLALLVMTVPSLAQRRPSGGQTGVARRGGPPHAFLFGTWTGGLFPVLEGMAAQDCTRQPTVVFAQDVVAHATLLDTGMARRVIETVRTSPAGAEIRLTPAPDDSGFGCENADVLHVARESDTMISFPRCAAFPYPLQKCAAPAG